MLETINLLLNLAGLGLWIGAFAFSRAAARLSRPLTLLSTLRPETSSIHGRLVLLGSLMALLVLRAAVYWNFSTTGGRPPSVDFGTLLIGFRLDLFSDLLAYSLVSFLVFLYLYYLWMVGISLCCRSSDPADSIENFLNQQLRFLPSRHVGWKVFISLFAGAGLWLAIGSALRIFGIGGIPREWPVSTLLLQSPFVAASFGCSFFLVMAAVLALHLISSYVYFGDHAVWPFVDRTAKVYLSPFRRFPLMFGRFDFAPICGILALLLLNRIGDLSIRWGWRLVWGQWPG